MSSMEEKIREISKDNRMLLEVKLVPSQGSRFQPTGFPEIGAATFENPDGKRMLIIESAQSMANRMESTIVKENSPEIIDEFKGLSYIVVHLKSEDGFESETSSLIEAHRINSPYITSDKNFVDKLRALANYTEGVYPNWEKIGNALFHFDINSLIHGAFMSNIGGRFRVPRALSAFVEGEDVKEALSGGAKLSDIDPGGKYKVKDGISTKSSYSNVPYPKMEYTAKEIKAYFNLDISLLKSYNLSVDETNLTIALSLFKIRETLENKLKLRTACDFKMDTKDNEFMTKFDRTELVEYIKQLISRTQNNMVLTELQANLIKSNDNKENNNKENPDSDEE